MQTAAVVLPGVADPSLFAHTHTRSALFLARHRRLRACTGPLHSIKFFVQLSRISCRNLPRSSSRPTVTGDGEPNRFDRLLSLRWCERIGERPSGRAYLIPKIAVNYWLNRKTRGIIAKWIRIRTGTFLAGGRTLGAAGKFFCVA